MQHTLTPYGPDIEPGIIDKPSIVEGLLALSAHIGSAHIMPRYDPIILSSRYDAAFHSRGFERVCALLAGRVSGCTLSFYDSYAKLEKRMAGLARRAVAAAGLADIADRHGLALYTCCEAIDLAPLGIRKGACISPALITAATGSQLISAKCDSAQRPV